MDLFIYLVSFEYIDHKSVTIDYNNLVPHKKFKN
jgi:hypothetical protein